MFKGTVLCKVTSVTCVEAMYMKMKLGKMILKIDSGLAVIKFDEKCHM